MITNFESWLNEQTSIGNIGPKRGRVVVAGETLEKFKDKVLAAIKEADPTSKAEFYPATGKIVGIMNTNNLRDLSVALRKVDSNLKAIIK